MLTSALMLTSKIRASIKCIQAGWDFVQALKLKEHSKRGRFAAKRRSPYTAGYKPSVATTSNPPEGVPN